MTPREVLNNYVYDKQKPPMLYVAILANDLHGAFSILKQEAKDTRMSLAELLKTIDMVHQFVPYEARGSLFKIEQWTEIDKP